MQSEEIYDTIDIYDEIKETNDVPTLSTVAAGYKQKNSYVKDITRQHVGINDIDDISGDITGNNIRATSKVLRTYKILVIFFTALIIVAAAIGIIIAAFSFGYQQQTGYQQKTDNVTKSLYEGNMRDCTDLYNNGRKRSGIYTVYPVDGFVLQVHCSMETAGGGWTTFQRRQDGSVNFNRTIDEYQSGFGNLNGEFWLGNENLAIMTNKLNRNYILRVHLSSFDLQNAFAEYANFRVGDQFSDFSLHVGNYSGTMEGCGLCCLNGNVFSTFYRSTGSDFHIHGSFWFNDVHEACVNLNGYYFHHARNDRAGIIWDDFQKNISLKSTTMMFKQTH